ncbi:hypothetical protein [Paractinoplanes durhamensis]|uniref:hypothetical protein n=1 Tax=Paractinoplanes durhamensis TaxID=113563 RepID=UPI0036362A9F
MRAGEVTGGGEVPGRLGRRGELGEAGVQLDPAGRVEQPGRGLGHIRRGRQQ